MMEDKLRVILGCESLKVIRRIEDRKELKYVVKVLGNEVKTMRDLDREVARTIFEAVPNWKREDRGLIYCLETDWTKELASYLNDKLGREVCGVYNAKMGTEERQEVLKAWKMGKIKFLAASSALGAGLDYGDVRLVIHHGHAQNLIDFSQESGRGGRDGKPAVSLTLFWDGLENHTSWIEKEGKDLMISWIKSKECRKKSLSIYLHGTGQDCLSQRDGELCDNCDEALKLNLDWESTVKTGQKRGRDMEEREVMDVVDLREMIGELKGRCTLCWMNGKEDGVRHELPQCR